MLLSLTEYLARFYSGFHVFQYLTLRAILAAVTALSMALFIGPTMIALLSRYQIGQRVRSDGPQSERPSQRGKPQGVRLPGVYYINLIYYKTCRKCRQALYTPQK